MGIPGIRWVSDGYPTGIPRVSRPWLGTGRYKLGKGTKKRREMIVCFITHLIKHGSAEPPTQAKLSTPIKGACAAVLLLGGPLLGPDSANILSSSRTRTIITTRAIDHREARCNLAHLAVSNSHAGNLAEHLRVADGTERTERTDCKGPARRRKNKRKQWTSYRTQEQRVVPRDGAAQVEVPSRWYPGRRSPREVQAGPPPRGLRRLAAGRPRWPAGLPAGPASILLRESVRGLAPCLLVSRSTL